MLAWQSSSDEQFLPQRLQEAERPGGETSIKVSRLPWEPGKPWGLELVEGTLQLREYTAGSIAAGCGPLKMCIGMELYTIDDRPVHSLAEVHRALEQADRSPSTEGVRHLGSVRLCFRHPLPVQQRMLSSC